MDEDAPPLVEVAKSESSRQQTAKRAAQILVGKNIGFCIPTREQKQNLLVAFAKQNLVIYGKAFDALKLLYPVDLDSLSAIEAHLDEIILYEIKSTIQPIGADFSGYFFALTAAELLVAQNLKKRFKFVFVNVTTEAFIELTLTEVFAKAKGIYPTWSISFWQPVEKVTFRGKHDCGDAPFAENSGVNSPRERVGLLFQRTARAVQHQETPPPEDLPPAMAPLTPLRSSEPA